MAGNENIAMKVDLSDFLTANGKLEVQEGKLNDILGRYSSLKNRTNEFIEDDDSRCAKMQEAVEAEIKKVRAELKMVQSVHERIQKVCDAMERMEQESEKIIDESKETIREGVEAIIDLSALGL